MALVASAELHRREARVAAEVATHIGGILEVELLGNLLDGHIGTGEQTLYFYDGLSEAPKKEKSLLLVAGSLNDVLYHTLGTSL